MKWGQARQSGNVVDRRGRGGVVLGGGGLIGVVALLAYVFLGGDPTDLIQQTQAPSSSRQSASGPADENSRFVAAVLGETEDVWGEIFRKSGGRYVEPRLVLFDGAVNSACGMASTAVGPFYCPEDQRVYLDLSFFDELSRRFGAAGDFPRAYVVAHEVGHHVQNLLGISERVRRAQQGVSRAEANALSVRLELQADFFAGVWAKHASRLLEPGDIEEALTAASAIGDDRLQRMSRGEVVPDSFTHGTSDQRRRWFLRGYQTGDLAKGDTFTARDL